MPRIIDLGPPYGPTSFADDASDADIVAQYDSLEAERARSLKRAKMVGVRLADLAEEEKPTWGKVALRSGIAFSENVYGTTKQAIGGLARNIGQLGDVPLLEEAGKDITDEGDKQIREAAELGQQLGGGVLASSAESLAGSFGGSVPMLIAGPLGRTAMAAATAVQTFGPTQSQFRDRLMELNPNLTEQEAFDQARLPAGLNAVASGLLTRAFGGVEKYIGRIAEEGLSRTAATSLLRDAWNSALGEFPEEYGQQLAQGLFEKAFIDRNKPVGEIFNEAGMAGLTGAVLGAGTVGGIGGVLRGAEAISGKVGNAVEESRVRRQSTRESRARIAAIVNPVESSGAETAAGERSKAERRAGLTKDESDALRATPSDEDSYAVDSARERAKTKIRRSSQTEELSQYLISKGIDAGGLKGGDHINFVSEEADGSLIVRIERHTDASVRPELVRIKKGQRLADAISEKFGDSKAEPEIAAPATPATGATGRISTHEEKLAYKRKIDDEHVKLFIEERDDIEHFGADSPEAKESSKRLRDFEIKNAAWTGTGRRSMAESGDTSSLLNVPAAKPATPAPEVDKAKVILLRQEGLSEAQARNVLLGKMTPEEAAQEVISAFEQRTADSVDRPVPTMEHMEAVSLAREEAINRINDIVSPAPETPVVTAQKQPWEMTRDESVARNKRIIEGNGQVFTKDSEHLTRENHREIVRDALREGKPVPPEVLADYRDLKPATPAKKGAQPYSKEAIQSAFNLTPEQAEAVDALVKALGLDESRIKVADGGSASERALLQMEDILIGEEKVPQFDRIAEVVKFIRKYASQNTVIPKGIQLASSKGRAAAVDAIVEHTILELAAWKKISKNYIPFYTADILERTNPALQRHALEKYGRKLSAAEIAFVHLLSAFGSGQAEPTVDTITGMRVFDEYMRTGRATGYTDKPKPVFRAPARGEPTVRVFVDAKTGEDTFVAKGNKPKFDATQKAQISKTYNVPGLARFNRVLDHFAGDLDKTIEWLGAQHTFEDIQSVIGAEAAATLKPHEYLNKSGLTFGTFTLGNNPKLGSYILNRWQKLGTITKDMWVARTMSRYFREPNTGKPWVTTVEGNIKRRILDEAWGIVAKRLGVEPAQIQEMMWDAEKQIYARFGQGSLGAYTSQGVEMEIARLNQDGAGAEPKGAVDFIDDGNSVLRGFSAADVSTGLHEFAHVARRQLLDRSVPAEQRLGISDKDIAAAEAWAGAKDGVWDRPAEEKFARGFERYLRDGKSPTPQLASIFAKFKEWLVVVYRKLAGSGIDVKISPEMRGVFDRLVTRSERLKQPTNPPAGTGAKGKQSNLQPLSDPERMARISAWRFVPGGGDPESLGTGFISGKHNEDIATRAGERGDIGLLITPLIPGYLKHANKYPFVAIDNGVFSKKTPFSEVKFRKLLDQVSGDKAVKPKVLFVVAPDVVGDAAATLDRFAPWSNEIRAKGLPVALAAQDGLESMMDKIPWDLVDVLFVGGSTEWKTGQMAPKQRKQWLSLFGEAHLRGIPIHMGRANTNERISGVAQEIGAGSVDGTLLAFGPTKNLVRLEKILENLNVKGLNLAAQNFPELGRAPTDQELYEIAIDPDVTSLDQLGAYAPAASKIKAMRVAAGIATSLEESPPTPAPAAKVPIKAGYKRYTVTLRKQFPAYNEKDGITYEDIIAKSKSEAVKDARQEADRRGHTGTMQGRMTFKAEESEDQFQRSQQDDAFNWRDDIQESKTDDTQQAYSRVTPKQDRLLRNFYAAANKVAGLTSYGEHEHVVPPNAWLFVWSNASNKWVAAGRIDSKYKGQTLKKDSDRFIASANNKGEADLIAENLPELPLVKNAFERNPLSELGKREVTNLEVLEFYSQMQEPPKSPDVVEATSRFMDKIRSPEQIAESKTSAAWSIPQQRVKSAGTSLSYPDPGKKSPIIFTAFKAGEIKLGPINADIGGGKYDQITNWLKTQGVTNIVWDRFNRSEEFNAASQAKLQGGKADTATVSNVLNVIPEEGSRRAVIATAFDSVKDGGSVYFSTYAAPKAGDVAGRDSYQLGRKTKDYISEIESVFGKGSVTLVGQILVATKSPVVIGESKTPVISGSLPAQSVAQHLADTHGVQPGGIVQVVTDPSANFDGRIIFDKDTGKLVRIEINSAKVTSTQQVDSAIDHEIGHAVWREGGVNAILATLSEADRAAIDADVTRLGYSPENSKEESGARGIAELAKAWSTRGWFQQIVGRVLAWANSHGFRLTRLAAELIAARAIANTKARVTQSQGSQTTQNPDVQQSVTEPVPPIQAEQVAGGVAQVGRIAEEIYAQRELSAQELEGLAYERKQYKAARTELKRLANIAYGRFGASAQLAPGAMVPDFSKGVSINDESGEIEVDSTFTDALESVNVPHNPSVVQHMQAELFFEGAARRLNNILAQIETLKSAKDHYVLLNAAPNEISIIDKSINKLQTQASKLDDATNGGGDTVGGRASEMRANAEERPARMAQRDSLALEPVAEFFGKNVGKYRSFLERAESARALTEALLDAATDPAEITRLTADVSSWANLPADIRTAIKFGHPLTEEQRKTVFATLSMVFGEFDIVRARMNEIRAARLPVIAKEEKELIKQAREFSIKSGTEEVMIYDVLATLDGETGGTGSIQGQAIAQQLKLQASAIQTFALNLGNSLETNWSLFEWLANPTISGGPAMFSVQGFNIDSQTLAMILDEVKRNPAFGSAIVTLVASSQKKLKNMPVVQLEALEKLVAEGKVEEAQALSNKLMERANANASVAESALHETLRKLDALNIERMSLDSGAAMFTELEESPEFRETRDLVANSAYGHLMEMVLQNNTTTTFLPFGTKEMGEGKWDKGFEMDASANPVMQSGWHLAAINYYQNAQRYLDAYGEAEKQHLEDPSKPQPSELGFDLAKVRGLRDATERVMPGMFLDISLLSENKRWKVPSVNRTISKSAWFRQHDQVAQMVGGQPGNELRIKLSDFVNHHLIGKSIDQKFSDLPRLRHKAMKSHPEVQMNTANYRVVWNEMAHWGRLQGTPVRVGFLLPVSGTAVTAEDIALLKREVQYEEELRRKVTETNTVSGVRYTLGDREYVRPGAYVGDEGLPRHLGILSNTFIADILAAYGDARTPIAPSTDLSSSSTDPMVAFWNKNLKDLKQHVLDVRREDRSMVIDPVMDRAEKNTESDWRLNGTPTIQSVEDLVNALVAHAPAMTGVNVRDRIISGLNSELRQYRDAAKRIENDRTERNKARNSGAAIAFSADNEFTKPAAKLELPSRLYDYGALTDSEHLTASSRANHERVVAYAVSVNRAIANLQGRVSRYENPDNAVSGEEAAYSYGGDIEEMKQVLGLLKAIAADFTAAYSMGAPAMTQAGWYREGFGLLTSAVLASPTVGLRNMVQGQFEVYALSRAMGLGGYRLTMWSAMKNAVRALSRFSLSAADHIAKQSDLGIATITGTDRKVFSKLVDGLAILLMQPDYRASAARVHELGFDTRESLMSRYQRIWQETAESSNKEELDASKISIMGQERQYAKLAGIPVKALRATFDKIGVQQYDQALNSSLLGYTHLLERRLKEVAINYGEAREAEGLGEFSFADKRWSLRPHEWAAFKGIQIKGNQQNEDSLARFRVLIDSSAAAEGFQLEQNLWDYYQKIKAGKTPQMFTGPQFDAIQRKLVADFNASTPANRSSASAGNPWVRNILTLQGYGADLLLKLINSTGGVRDRATAASLLTKIPIIGSLAIMAVALGYMAASATGEWDRRLRGKMPSLPTPLDKDFWTNWKRWGSGTIRLSAAQIPYIGDLLLGFMGQTQGNKGFDPVGRIWPVSVAQGLWSAVTGSWKTYKGAGSLMDSVTPMLDFGRKIGPYWLEVENAFGKAQGSIKQGERVIRGEASNLDLLPESRGGGGVSYGPTTIVRRNLGEAVSAYYKSTQSGDAEGAASALVAAKAEMAKLEAFYTKKYLDAGDTPEKAKEKAVRDVWNDYQEINPVVSAMLGKRPTQAQFDLIRAGTTGERGAVVDTAVKAWQAGAQALFNRPGSITREDVAGNRSSLGSAGTGLPTLPKLPGSTVRGSSSSGYLRTQGGAPSVSQGSAYSPSRRRIRATISRRRSVRRVSRKMPKITRKRPTLGSRVRRSYASA